MTMHDYWGRNRSETDRTWNKQIDADWLVFGLIHRRYVHPQSSIVELGFGYNRLLRSLLKHFPHKEFKYTGIDLSPTMVTKAKEEFPEYTFLEGDFSKDPLAIPPHDVIISIVTFKHIFPDFGEALKHLRPVCKQLLFDVPLIYHWRRLPPVIRREEEGYYQRAYSVEEVVQVVVGAGYAIVDSFPVIQNLDNTETFYPPPIIRDMFVVKPA